MTLRKVVDVSQLQEPTVEIWIDDTAGQELVELRQGASVVRMQNGRAEAIIGAIRYGCGEIISTPV